MTSHYSVHIETRGPNGAPQVDLSLIETFFDHVVAHDLIDSAVVSGGGNSPSYGATLDVPAPGPVNAAEIGAEAFADAARSAGLPAWPVSVIEVLDYDEVDRRNSAPLVPDVIGQAEALALLNESTLPEGFPEPIQTLTETGIWLRSAVLGWLEHQE